MKTIAQIAGLVRGTGNGQFEPAFGLPPLAPAEDFRRDSDLFGDGVRSPAAQARIQAARQRGFQTRAAARALGRMLGELGDR
jgi:hypothetical protein